MQITVKGRHVGVSEKLRQHVHKRLDSAVSKYFASAIVAQVAFERTKHLFETDIVIHVGSGITLQARGDANEIYACFDIAAERIEKRLRRYKRKLRDHHREFAERERESLPAQQYVLAAEDGDDVETEQEEAADAAPVIVAETKTQIDTLSVSEAVMRMDLGELPALMFRNSNHGGMNVVYRRPDGHIGWIDPKQPDQAG